MAPNRYGKGFQLGQEWAPKVCEVTELADALHRVYTTDALLVTYVAEGLTHQPRINKPGLSLYPHRLFIRSFLCDVDNPAHGDWTDEEFERAREQDRTLPSLQTAGVYYTLHGRRIVQPLREPLLVDDRVEEYIRRWYRQLEAEGIAVDWDCAQWNRYFQLPHVPKQPGGRSRCVDFDRMVPIDVDPLPELEPEAPRPARSSKARGGAKCGSVVPWTTDLPDRWRPIAEKLAAAVRNVSSEWHSLFLAIAGALLGRRVPPEHVPALCNAISVLTSADDRSSDRIASAHTTVQRWQDGYPVTGYSTLASEWPDVADALDDALAEGEERRLRDLVGEPAEEVPVRSLAETTAALEEAIRSAPDGLTLIQAGCGLGKTRAAERVAAERAAKPYASSNAQGLRAPPQSKTSLSVDKHALARQVVTHLRVLGNEAAWHHGPLAKVDEDGKPVCHYAEVAKPLVEGGQPMQWILCRGRDLEPCEHFATCTAKDGYEGPEHPRVHVGVHNLISTLDASAGSSGLLVLDEPPTLLETLTFTAGDFTTAFGALDCFDGAYGAALRPALEAVQAWLTAGALATSATDVASVVATLAHVVAPDVLEQARRSSGQKDGDAIACAKGAPLSDKGPPAPPLRWEQVGLVRRDPAKAARVGQASRVLRAIHHALTSDAPVAVRLEQRGPKRVMHLTRVREDFRAALKRDGSVVVLDANVDIWAPVYAKVVGYDRPVQRFHAPDGAPVERTLHRLTQATRTAWLPDGRFQLRPNLKTAVRAAIDWALRDPGNGVLAVIAIHAVELALRAAFDPTDATVDAAWVASGQLPETLAEARAQLGPIVQAWKGRILFGHFGALRGLDDMAEADCLVTLGDPWSNIEQVRHECAFLGLDDWEARLEAMCRAELEQAQGRLRTVHRTRPARALHVGAVAPGGPGWAHGRVKVERAAMGRPATGETLPLDLLRAAIAKAGGTRAAARRIGVSPATVSLALAGKRSLPVEAARNLAQLADQS